MKTPAKKSSPFQGAFRSLLAGLALLTGLAACSDGADQAAPAGPEGEIKYSYNGTAYTADAGSVSAIYSPGDSSITINGSVGQEHSVGLGLRNVKITGAGVYQLRRGSSVNRLATGIFRLPAAGANVWNTLYGPSAVNGTVTVSQLDLAGGKLVGTFTFTAGPLPNTGAAGTKSVTSGSFSFSKIR